MKSPTARSRRHGARTAVLSGCKATFVNEFRRKSSRSRDLFVSLGFPVGAEAVSTMLVVGQVLTLLVIAVGLAWVPPVAGLKPFGIPLRSPELASVGGLLITAGFMQSRRRFRRLHAQWAILSRPLEAGMRAGVALLDLGLALMLAVQNLRWGETANIFSAGAIMMSALLVVSPTMVWLIRSTAFTAIIAAIGSLFSVLAQTPWHGAVAAVDSGIMPLAIVALAGLAVTAVGTPLLYRHFAHKYALQTRGLLLDMGLKASSIYIVAAISVPLAGFTPWPGTAPYILITLFFLGLVLFRSSFVRTSSPEALGVGLFIYRLVPQEIRSLLVRGLKAYALLVTPLTVSLMPILLMNGYPQAVALLGSLTILEIAIDALVIQRRTAVMPASHISRLAQRSKSGLGAALCAGLAATLSGILGGVIPQATETPWLATAAAALIVVATLLLGVALTDAPAWLRGLSVTETEES